ncbi:MAG: GatB/YqeY domain-containing protein [Nitrospirae bacterium]|nr:GatB/YqeY domain-containing protein [Nitrospirota bacterium]
MSLLDRLSTELKESLKAGNQIKLSVIRLLKSSIKNKEIEKMSPLTDEEIIGVISSAVKQRREAIEQFKKGNREDLVQKETSEIEILQTFLPQQLSDEEIMNEVRTVINEAGASSPKDMGKVMKILIPRIKGRADGTKVSTIVKELMESSSR